ncbi:hypothetical protein [Microlunatus flavus]|uniref:Uncharacterized protein n=1 Tax=Microlunatus flavus TaxID=1036181 RepID=A0A1H9DP33_9ACTN|nr:hypothetical protein [Microlunatus flavus]SEQ14468.1 hypothetical protein SAMN05421756_102586 [Microlunatus flavus]
MSLTWSRDTDAARWLLGATVPWTRLVELGPDGFAAYARLRIVPDPVRDGQTEADQDLPDDHPSELEQVRLCLEVLAGWTTTPDTCWFAVWDGYPGSLDVPADLPRFDVVGEGLGAVRRYGLLRGSVSDLEHWDEVAPGFLAAPAFVWPDDRRWCLAKDVDPHWAGIGGEPPAIEALLDRTDLDVVRTDPEEPQPYYR